MQISFKFGLVSVLLSALYITSFWFGLFALPFLFRYALLVVIFLMAIGSVINRENPWQKYTAWLGVILSLLVMLWG